MTETPGGSWKGKVAIVTGGGQGIGGAYVRALAARGAAVVIAEIDEGSGRRLADELAASGSKVLFHRTDVSSPESTKAAAERAVEAFGGIDFLVNNAAIFGGMRREGLLTVDWDYYRRFLDVNMNGALLMVRAVHTHMAARGGGAIVNQSSTAAYQAGHYYSVSKTALNALTIGLAKELGPMNIRINGIAPGPTDTPALQATVPVERRQALLAQMPLKRLGTPQDLVNVCLFLLSDEASWVTGQTWCVDGGQILKV